MIVLLSKLMIPFLSFFTFNGFIHTLCNAIITCDNSFVMLGGFFTVFSHMTVPFSHFTVSISHLIVRFSLFPYFSLTFDYSILTSCNFNITCDSSFNIFGGSLTLFLTFNGSILILYCFCHDPNPLNMNLDT